MAAANQVICDIANMKDNTTFVLGFGAADIGKGKTYEVKQTITKIIQQCDKVGMGVNM